MNVADEWQVEMDRMLVIFERESESSLRKINRRFEVLARPFNNEFKNHFLKLSTQRLEMSFSKVEMERWNNGQVKSTETILGSEPECQHLHRTSSDCGNRITPSTRLIKREDIRSGIVKEESVIEIVDSNDEDEDDDRASAMNMNMNIQLLKNEDPIEIDESNDEEIVNKQLDGLAGVHNAKTIPPDTNGPVKMTEVRTRLDRCYADHRNNVNVNGNSVDGFAEVENLNDNNELNESGSSSQQAMPTNESKNKNEVGRNVFRPYKCKLCDFATRQVHSLKYHKRIHADGKLIGVRADSNGLYHCSHCIRKFINVAALSRHMKIHKNGQHLYYCGHCMRQFVQEAMKNKHESQCEGHNFECHLCKVYVTNRESLMQVHMRTHSGAKPFGCRVCNKHFQQKSSLKKHLNTIHSRVNP